MAGLPILTALKPYLAEVVADKDGYSRLSTDVYLGQQVETIVHLKGGCNDLGLRLARRGDGQKLDLTKHKHAFPLLCA